MTHLIRVLLPVPDGPIIATLLRPLTSKLISFRIGLPATYSFLRFSIRSDRCGDELTELAELELIIIDMVDYGNKKQASYLIVIEI